MADPRRPPRAAETLLADAAQSMPGALALASLVPQAARIERALLRALRLQLMPQRSAADEAELWSSELVEVRGLDGLLLRADVLEILRRRARPLLAAGGEAASLLHRARQLLDSHHAQAPPLVRLEEEIAWLAMADAQPAAAIERRLEVALAALVRDRRVGVARWAARALPRLPGLARQTRTAWLLSLATADRLPAAAGALGVAMPPGTGVIDLAALAPHLGTTPLGVRRIGDRVELGAVGPGGVAIQVPASEPRFISLHDPAARRPVEIAVPAGSLQEVTVGWQTLTLHSADGQAWDLPVHSEHEQRWLAGITLRLAADGGEPGRPPRWLGTATGPDRLLTALPDDKLMYPLTASLADGRPQDLDLTLPFAAPNALTLGRVARPFPGIATLPTATGVPEGARVVACGLDGRGELQPVVGIWSDGADAGPSVLARTLAAPDGCLGAPVVIDGRLAGVVYRAFEADADPAGAPPATGRTLRLLVGLSAMDGSTATDNAATAPPPATDQLTVELLPAAQGQAVLVSWGPADHRHHLLVDGGPRTTAKAVVARVRAATGGRLELIVASHGDADRIDGLSELLAAGIEPREVWFNSPRQLAGQFGDSGAPTAAVERLTDRLASLGLPVNTAFGGGPVAVPPEGPLPRIELAGGAVITLLSPTPELLETASVAWRRAAERRGGGATLTVPASESAAELSPDENDEATGSSAAQTSPSETRARTRKAPARRFGSDRSANNGASIVLLFEYHGQQVLLPGDAHADALLRAVRRLATERERSGLFVDLFVLPHAGSLGNVTPELFDVLEAGAYAISTNGALFGHPDPETIELIAQRPRPAVIAFNYRTKSTERWADPVLAKKFGLATRYPDRDREGITLALEPARA